MNFLTTVNKQDLKKINESSGVLAFKLFYLKDTKINGNTYKNSH